jgi:Lon protease-like protein
VLDSRALEALPIFPLPDVVLFPGALLPLHVFEQRYRDLTAHVLGGSRIMAVPRLRPGYQAEYQGRPPVFETTGVGFVVDSERQGDGRYNLVLRGVARVAIREELPPDRSFRLVRARLLVDHAYDEALLAAAHERVLALCDRLALGLGAEGAGLVRMVRSVQSPGGCADLIAAALVTDPDERQALLETLDPTARLERIAGHVAALVARAGGPRQGPAN